MRIDVTAKEIVALLRLVELDAEAQSLLSEAQRSRREETRMHVPRALLDRYRVLLEVGRVPVIVAIERGACSGCHVRLPTMLEHKTRRSPGIHTCPRCHRMLYAPDLIEGAAPGSTAGRKPADKPAPGT